MPHSFDWTRTRVFCSGTAVLIAAVSYKQMIGTVIGNYRIVEKIGEGGMGVVYKALDTQLDRMVAIKALSAELSGNPALVERFRAEARAQAKLNHSNLATLYAFLVQDGIAYMAMEFVDGETFHGMLMRRGAMPAAEAVPLFRQALAGIGHAHRLGIVHRDIKPSNLMLNREGIVKVMDFGLAQVTGSHRMTRTGVRLGTAYYMSPEQVLVKPVDARSDIYSLGAALYEVLAGRVPFDADSEFEILNGHVNTPPPPPSRLRQIPQGIENAVLKALAKDPDQRFQSAEQFSAALERPEEFYLAATMGDAEPVAPDRMVVITPVPVAPPKPAFWTGGRKAVAVGGGVLACLLAGWLILRPEPRSTPQPPPAPARTQAQATSATAPSAPVASPPKPVTAVKTIVVVGAGTSVFVLAGEPIDSNGQEFRARLADDVNVEGHEAFRAGDKARFRLGEGVIQSQGKPEKILQLISITTRGHDYTVEGSAPVPKKRGLQRLADKVEGKSEVTPGTIIDFTLSAPVKVAVTP
jgi:hypothetical protein